MSYSREEKRPFTPLFIQFFIPSQDKRSPGNYDYIAISGHYTNNYLNQAPPIYLPPPGHAFSSPKAAFFWCFLHLLLC